MKKARPRPASAPIPSPPPQVTAIPTPADLDQAKEDALLQLRIGRSAHYYAVVVSAALLVDAFLVLFFPPNLVRFPSQQFHEAYFIIFPLFSALYLSAFGLYVKWEDYQLWPWEPHFSVTLASVPFNALLVYLYVAALVHYGPTGHWSILPWFYPLSLVGLGLPLVGLALTWAEWGHRKTISLAAAVAPIPLSLILYLPNLAGTSADYAIAISLSASAVLCQMSGSFLHLIASGTRVHEREVISSGQNRLFQFAADLRQREDAVRFREATVVGREADVENSELSLTRKLDALEEARTHVTTLESDVRARSESAATLQRELAKRLAETNAQAGVFDDRDAALGLRERDLAARLPKVADREQDLQNRDADLMRREADHAQKARELATRSDAATAAEARLEARRAEIERKTGELLQREVASKRSAATTPGGGASAQTGANFAEQEARLAHVKATLDEQNALLGRKSAEVRAAQEAVRKAREEVDKKAEEVRTRDTGITRRERDSTERLALADNRLKEYEEALKLHGGKIQAVESRIVDISQKSEEVARRESTIADREKSVELREQAIGRERVSLDAGARDILLKAKKLGALEDELRYREQSLARRPASVGLGPAMTPSEMIAATGGPASRRAAGGSEPESPVEEPGPLTAPITERFSDRAPTGTPRLDDLLLGGIPPSGHVMLIGDAFVGKEIVAYAFITEGLKRGESAIVITAARGPDELAQRIGLVSPQFREYEQLGMVHWVDASAPEGSAEARAGSATRFPTAGPQDHAGILSALVKSANSLVGKPPKGLRVAFLGLSATLAHAEERQRVQFLQNVVGVLKPRNALALYTLETGSLPESQIETILSRMDGAIYFKREREKTLLSVLGVGEVATRDWVEYRATNRAITVGSFALERIR